MKITGTTTLPFCILIVVSTLDVISSTGISWTKYTHRSDFDGFSCVPDATLFVADDVSDPLTCGLTCYKTNQCLDYFLQPESHQCIGCSVYVRSTYSTKRIEPLLGTTHFSEHGSSLSKFVSFHINQKHDIFAHYLVKLHSFTEEQCLKPDDNRSSNECERGCYISGHSVLYSGYQRKTQRDKTCQRWDTDTPHQKNADLLEEKLPEKSFTLAENYCRDPDEEGRPWCYTTDPNDRWGFCDVPPCNKRECFMLGFANLYDGDKNVTKGNITCQRWDQQYPHEHGFTSLDNFPDASIKEANNYCRSPDRLVQPWCYTTNKNKGWDFCDVEICVLDYCFYESASTYQGRVYYTERRVQCQRWDSTKPHSHDFGNMPSKFPDATVADAENYCRDPSGRGRPWCFTTDPNTVWDWCSVKKCWDNNV